MRFRNLGPAAVAVALALAVGACSEQATAPVESSTSETVADSTTTTSTTVATTTSTTVDPKLEAEAAVEAAYLRAYEVFTTCYRTLPDCEPAIAFAEVYTGGTYERLSDAAVVRKADRLVYEAPAEPQHARTEIRGITIDSSLVRAVVKFCTFAGDTELAISDDGTRIPVGLNDTVLVEWGEAELVVDDDGVWRIADYLNDSGNAVQVPIEEIDKQLEEGLLCGDSTSGA